MLSPLKDYPDHHDAELVLRLYDLRREALMRASRNEVNGKYWPRTEEEASAVMKTDHPMNAAFRQVATYWDMAYSMVKHGVLHAEFMLESNSEGMLLFAKVQPFLDSLRKYNPTYFRNAEWVATETEAGKRAYERYRTRVEQQRAAR